MAKAMSAGVFGGVSEFDRNCTLLIHRSHHHYSQTSNSVTETLLAAAVVSGSATGVVSNQNLSGYYFPQQPQINNLQKRLEDSHEGTKLQALKEVILWTLQPAVSDTGISNAGSLSGSSVASKLLMTIIRFVLPSTSHRIKRMSQLYWEIVDKTNPNGQLKEEMILACNKFREDLLHSNEYIRGSTLRMLCKIQFVKILEPLAEAVIENLSHPHAYVRRYAVLCLECMIKSMGQDVFDQAAEEIERLILTETDLTTKRNAFMMLINCDLNRAINYALSVQDTITCAGDFFQLAFLELLRKVYRENPTQTSNLLRTISVLVDTCSPSVAYEGSNVLLHLSASSSAVKAATSAYVRLFTGQGDNNIKLIVLDRLKEISHHKHRSVLELFVIDIFRSLSHQSLELKKRALSIASRSTTSQAAKESIEILRRELVKSLFPEFQQCYKDNLIAYQHALLQTIRRICREHLVAAQLIVNTLTYFVPDHNVTTSTEIVTLLRDFLLFHPELRHTITTQLCEMLPLIPFSRPLRCCIWLLGEYAETVQIYDSALNTLYDLLQPLPFAHSEFVSDSDAKPANDDTAHMRSSQTVAKPQQWKTCTVVLPDGTYGSKTVMEKAAHPETRSFNPDKATDQTNQGFNDMSTLRMFVLHGDCLLSSSIAMSIAKLALKRCKQQWLDEVDIAKCLLMIGSLLKAILHSTKNNTTSEVAVKTIQALKLTKALLPKEGQERADPAKLLHDWFPDTKGNAEAALKLEVDLDALEIGASGDALGAEGEVKPAPPDKLPFFRQLGVSESQMIQAAQGATDLKDDLQRALGVDQNKGSVSHQKPMAKVQQMSGSGDALYVEATLSVNQFDLIVEFLVINQSNEVLQNVTIELTPHGNLKVVERPAVITLVPQESRSIHASIRVNSVEAGIIFGHLTYDKSTHAEKIYMLLQELQIDILNFVRHHYICEANFRSIWAECEWENKIAIDIHADIKTFLASLMAQSNMTIVGKIATAVSTTSVPEWSYAWTAAQEESYCTPASKLGLPYLEMITEDSSFFSINLYFKSIFDEEALTNVSVEKLTNGRLSGQARIRSRVKGVALCLGNLVTTTQRNFSRLQSKGLALATA